MLETTKRAESELRGLLALATRLGDVDSAGVLESSLFDFRSVMDFLSNIIAQKQSLPTEGVYERWRDSDETRRKYGGKHVLWHSSMGLIAAEDTMQKLFDGHEDCKEGYLMDYIMPLSVSEFASPDHL